MFAIITIITTIIHRLNLIHSSKFSVEAISSGAPSLTSQIRVCTTPLGSQSPCAPSLSLQSNLLFTSLPSPLNCKLSKGKDCDLFVSTRPDTKRMSAKVLNCGGLNAPKRSMS